MAVLRPAHPPSASRGCPYAAPLILAACCTPARVSPVSRSCSLSHRVHPSQPLPLRSASSVASAFVSGLFKASALSLFKQSQRLFSSLSAFESVPPSRNYAGCPPEPQLRPPEPQLRRLRKAAPLGAGELGALPVGSAGWALAGGWEAPAGGRQGGRGDPGGGKGRCRVGREVAHPGPSPDPDKEMSTIRLFR